MESDHAFRRRMLLAYNQLSTAGSAGSYEFHALSAHSDVADVAVKSPQPGEVLITVMSHQGNGSATQALLNVVDAALNAETVRPVSDRPVVQSVQVIDYSITAVLLIYPSVSASVALSEAQASVAAYVAAHRKIGHDISVSAVNAALHVTGVQSVAALSLDAVAAIVGQATVLRNGSVYRDGSVFRNTGGVTGVSGSVADVLISDTQLANNTAIDIVIQGVNA